MPLWRQTARVLHVWFRKISFVFYMCEMVTIFYLRYVTGGPKFSTPVGILVLLGLFAATVLGGWLLYRFVEMPMMRRWGRKRPGLVPVSGVDGRSAADAPSRLGSDDLAA